MKTTKLQYEKFKGSVSVRPPVSEGNVNLVRHSTTSARTASRELIIRQATVVKIIHKLACLLDKNK